MSASPENQILNNEQVLRKIRRIAVQVYEHNFEETELVVVGVEDTGYDLAALLVDEIKAVSPLAVELFSLSVNKVTPFGADINLNCPVEKLENQVVLMVDDVLNTGRTLAYSIKPFLEMAIKKLQLAVLVDRNHRSFPISPDYVGYELSTTIKQHIEVRMSNVRECEVFLY